MKLLHVILAFTLANCILLFEKYFTSDSGAGIIHWIFLVVGIGGLSTQLYILLLGTIKEVNRKF